MTDSDPWGNSNSVIKQKAILPGENQKLAEAALIDMTDKNLKIIEKKYDVNGVKTNYFSQLFLQCPRFFVTKIQTGDRGKSSGRCAEKVLS